MCPVFCLLKQHPRETAGQSVVGEAVKIGTTAELDPSCSASQDPPDTEEGPTVRVCGVDSLGRTL